MNRTAPRAHASPSTTALAGLFAASALLVLFRSAVWIIFEQSHYDSDQGVSGLMATHLSEGRAFPLFIYGQHYLLAVEAWLAAPLFAVFGPSVAALKVVPLAFNLAAVWLLLWLLVRRAFLRPADAFIAALFILLPPPIPSSRLVEAIGGNVEPLFYIPLLWWLRDRPLSFGLVAGIAILNREFSAYGVAALAVLDVLTKKLLTRDGLKMWTVRAAGMLLSMLAVRLLEPFADLRGPGTAGAGISAPNQLMCWNAGDFVGNMRWLFTDNLGNLFGWHAQALGAYVESRVLIGHPFVVIPMTMALGAAVFFGVKHRQRATPEARSLAAYLALVGLFTIAAYVLLGCRIRDGMLIRYTLLALLLPVSVLVLFFSGCPSSKLRTAVTACVLLWALASGVDHTRVMSEYVSAPPPNDFRALVNFLDSHGVRYGYAPYWTTYAVDFLSHERIALTSSELVRTDEQQRLVTEHDNEAIRILPLVDNRCPGGVAFRRWCLLYLENARRSP